MTRTLKLIACAATVWLAAPPTATADPIAITGGMITLPTGLPAPTTLTGTDGVRAFTFEGAIFDSAFGPDTCHPCFADIGVDITSASAAFGTVNYGSESYRTGEGLGDDMGELSINVRGDRIPLPVPIALGEIRSFSTLFTASGILSPPLVPGGLANTLTGSGAVTLTLAVGPGNEEHPLVWTFRRAEYQFGEQAGGPAPVPEPASFLLLGSGLSALLLKRRSRAV